MASSIPEMLAPKRSSSSSSLFMALSLPEMLAPKRSSSSSSKRPVREPVTVFEPSTDVQSIQFTTRRGRSRELYHHEIVICGEEFVVDGGEVRYINDPANSEFIESLRNRKCPAEFKEDGAHMIFARRGLCAHIDICPMASLIPEMLAPKRSSSSKRPVREPVTVFEPSTDIRSIQFTTRRGRSMELHHHEIVICGDEFVVDGGKVWYINDPTNSKFIESLRNRKCPAEFKEDGAHMIFARRGLCAHIDECEISPASPKGWEEPPRMEYTRLVISSKGVFDCPIFPRK